MSSRGTLYEEVPTKASGVVTWKGNLSTHVSEPQKRNLFLQSLYEEQKVVHNSESHDSHGEIQDKDIVESLENEVQYWTDFSKVHYHPQSLYEFNGQWVDAQQFNNFGVGRAAFSDGLQGEEITERLRFFIEECDHIQGIQYIVDDSGGFAGVAAEFLEHMADEYTNVPVLLYSARDPCSYMNGNSRKRSVSQNLHDAISFSRLSSYSKLIVPIGLPSLRESQASKFLYIENEKTFHTSAVYASALHSISLPFRMEPLGPTNESPYVSGSIDVNGVIQMLAGQARQNNVTILDVAMPAPDLTGKHVEQSLLGNLRSLTPETSVDAEDLLAVEYMTVQGAYGLGGQRASISEVKDAVGAAYDQLTARPRFSHLSVSRSPLPIPLPFPSIFGNHVGQHGELLENPISTCLSRGSLDVHSIPISARLRSSNAVLPFVENRLGNLRRLGLQRGAVGTDILRSWGIEREEVVELGETLAKMVATLNPYSDNSSDSD